MNRLILKSLNPLLVVILALLGLTLQSTLFNWGILQWLHPDFVLILVIWLALKREFTEGGILTILLASFAEVHSAAPRGVFLFDYMLIFLSIRAFSKMFVVYHIRQWIGVTALCSAVWLIGNAFLVFFLKGQGIGFVSLLASLVQNLLPTAIASYWLYPFMDRFDTLTFKKREREHTLEDDIQIFEEESI